MNYEMSLAGNFGEPRAHHFHGGIDIKTERVENKPVFSVGSGYVSRVVIGKYGYGKAVYVKHPEGYTSMFCHLNAFCPKIENIVRERDSVRARITMWTLLWLHTNAQWQKDRLLQ